MVRWLRFGSPHRRGVFEALIIRRGNRAYELPKGRHEGRERPRDTAKRELYEESGLFNPVTVGALIAWDDYSLDYGRTRKAVCYFLAWCGPGTILFQRGESFTTEVRWVNAAAVPPSSSRTFRKSVAYWKA